MVDQGPLAGLRVVDLTDDLGRFATKLLAELGASVCRPMGAGSPGAAIDGPAGEFGGVLDWWFDAAKTRIDLDLDTAAGRRSYRELVSAADLVVESTEPGFLADRGLDHDTLVVDNPRLTQVAVTPFGRTGPRAGWRSSDLVAGALGGVLSITGTADEPLNSWGWQNHNFAGFAAAVCGLAGVLSARATGRGQLVDLSAHEVVASSMENLLMQYVYDDHLPDLPAIAARQGSLHWLGVYEVVPARTGAMMISPTPHAEHLVDWMVAEGITEAEPFVGVEAVELLAQAPAVMAAIRRFALTGDAATMWWEAQQRHIAFGEVQSVATVAANPQFAHRGFFSDARLGGEGGDPSTTTVRGPFRTVRFSDTPTAPPVAVPRPVSADDLAERWAAARPSPASDRPPISDVPSSARPLDGVVVLDLSWVLAGPFGTRLLGDLGAEVVKIQTEERATLVNQPEFPYYPVWNRSKRSVTIDLKHPDAGAVIRPLVEAADVLVENYSAGVLDRLGLGWDQVKGWNERLVYVSMSGCGHDGPWADVISYAPTIHALCGLTHLTNPAGRGDVGCGFSLNDHAAGFAAAVAALAALAARDRTGRGQLIDMAQLEVGAHLIGPALVDYFATGREAMPAGNADGLTDSVPNDVWPCRGGRFVAITASDDAMWRALAAETGLDPGLGPTVATRRSARAAIGAGLARWCAGRDAEEAMEALQRAGVAAGVVQNAADLVERDPQLEARAFWSTEDRGPFGPRTVDRFPAIWSRSDLSVDRPPPSYLGEANFDVLTNLAGLTEAEVAEGIASGLFR